MKFNEAKISFVIVVDDIKLSGNELKRIDDLLFSKLERFELVVVCNNFDADIQRNLIQVTEDIPDVTVHFLYEKVDYENAVLIGMDNAIGEWVTVLNFLDITEQEIDYLVDGITQGYSCLTVYEEAASKKRISLSRAVESVYYKFLGGLTNLNVSGKKTMFKVFSREASLFILRSRYKDMYLKSDSIIPGFPAKTDSFPSQSTADKHQRISYRRMKRGFKHLLFASYGPARIILSLGLLGAFSNFIYTFYIILSYYLKDDVQPGWTTTSLQSSLMFMLICFMFVIMSEFIFRIERRLSSQMFYSISREVRSKNSREVSQYNVARMRNE